MYCFSDDSMYCFSDDSMYCFSDVVLLNPIPYLTYYMSVFHTVKPVLRGHLWDKEKWSFKTGDLLIEVQFI